MIALEGDVVADHAVRGEYPHSASLALRGLDWHADRWRSDALVSFDLGETIVTSGYVPIERASGRLFLNQSYGGVEHIFPVRFAMEGGRYCLASQPSRLQGRYVVVGGPIDQVWYHWLFSWAPRLLLLRRLRPALFDDPDVKFLVHPTALEEPFRAVLDTFAIPAERLVAADPRDQDLALDAAVLVAFPDQRILYPELAEAFSAHLRRRWGVRGPRLRASRRVFASRQDLPAPRRRIHNWEALHPMLKRLGFRVEALARLSAKAQAQLFHDAHVVLAAHGSDLTDILFCRPGATVVVIESALSVDLRMHLGLQRLCELRGLRYVLFVSQTSTSAHEPDMLVHRLLRDYDVDTQALEAVLRPLLRAAAPRGASSTPLAWA